MEDKQIVALYWERSEQAITETDIKYGAYCRTIAGNILSDEQDMEECVSDTYLRAWNTMPPQRPAILSAFLGKITRNLSLDRFRTRTAQKRGAGQTVLALSELEECIPASASTEEIVELQLLTGIIERFLHALSDEKRRIFLQRYWYLMPVREIAQQNGMSESKITSMLHRTRKELRTCLEKEEIL